MPKFCPKLFGFLVRISWQIFNISTCHHQTLQSLFRYHWYKLSHNTLPDKRRRRAPNHGITLNPIFSLIFSRLTCSCWNESNLIWIGFYTVIYCTHSSETPHSPQDLKQHSWPFPFWKLSKNIFKTQLRPRSSYYWVGPFVLRSEKSRFLGTSADGDSDLGLFELFARSGNLLYAEEPGGPGEVWQSGRDFIGWLHLSLIFAQVSLTIRGL